MEWPRYARALDMRLQGCRYREIAEELGVSKERARQLTLRARHQLAFRVFKGVPRRSWEWDGYRNRWEQSR
jgi:DNA-directed RNA polymerase specialized sigma24 family protein